MMFRNNAAHHAQRVDVRVASDHGAGVQHAVAADLSIVTQHRAELAKTGLIVPFPILHDHVLPVGLHVGCDGAGAHVRLHAEDRVAHVIVMRNLDPVEQDNVLKLRRIPDGRALSDDRAAADESALADLRVLPDNAGAGDGGGRRDLRALCDPDVFALLLILFRIQRGTELFDEIRDKRKCLPWIGQSLKQVFCDRFV